MIEFSIKVIDDSSVPLLHLHGKEESQPLGPALVSGVREHGVRGRPGVVSLNSNQVTEQQSKIPIPISNTRPSEYQMLLSFIFAFKQ